MNRTLSQCLWVELSFQRFRGQRLEHLAELTGAVWAAGLSDPAWLSPRTWWKVRARVGILSQNLLLERAYKAHGQKGLLHPAPSCPVQTQRTRAVLPAWLRQSPGLQRGALTCLTALAHSHPCWPLTGRVS